MRRSSAPPTPPVRSPTAPPRSSAASTRARTSHPTAAELARAAIVRHGIAGRVIVAGFDPAATRPLRGAGFALGASTPDVVRLVLPALLRRRVGASPFQALCIPLRWNGIPVPIAALARALRGRGTVIHVWTIDDPADAIGLWNIGVQGIVSDDPATILAARPWRRSAERPA